MAIANTIQSMQSNLKSAYDKIGNNKSNNLSNGTNQNIWVSGNATQFGKNDGNSGLCIETDSSSEYIISTKVVQTRYRVAFTNDNPVNVKQTTDAYNGVVKDNTSDTITKSSVGYKYLIVNATDLSNIVIQKVLNKNLQNLSTTIQSELDNIYSKVIDKGGSLRTKNLFSPNNFTTKGNVSISGDIISSTSGSGDIWGYSNSQYKDTLSSGTYTLTAYFITPETINWGGIVVCDSSNLFKTNYNIQNANKITMNFTLSSTTNIGIMFKLQSGVCKVQLEEGTTATDYVPYEYEKNLYNLSKVIDSIPNE